MIIFKTNKLGTLEHIFESQSTKQTKLEIWAVKLFLSVWLFVNITNQNLKLVNAVQGKFLKKGPFFI